MTKAPVKSTVTKPQAKQAPQPAPQPPSARPTPRGVTTVDPATPRSGLIGAAPSPTPDMEQMAKNLAETPEAAKIQEPPSTVDQRGRVVEMPKTPVVSPLFEIRQAVIGIKNNLPANGDMERKQVDMLDIALARLIDKIAGMDKSNVPVTNVTKNS